MKKVSLFHLFDLQSCKLVGFHCELVLQRLHSVLSVGPYKTLPPPTKVILAMEDHLCSERLRHRYVEFAQAMRVGPNILEETPDIKRPSSVLPRVLETELRTLQRTYGAETSIFYYYKNIFHESCCGSPEFHLLSGL